METPSSIRGSAEARTLLDENAPPWLALGIFATEVLALVRLSAAGEKSHPKVSGYLFVYVDPVPSIAGRFVDDIVADGLSDAVVLNAVEFASGCVDYGVGAIRCQQDAMKTDVSREGTTNLCAKARAATA